MTSSSHLTPCNIPRGLTRASSCGCGSMRRRTASTTCTWTWGRRSDFEWWTRVLWTRPRSALTVAQRRQS
ncbi:hypothetical protein NP493_386g05052 [Ridgeia piscesae]|uniref:Uncharacterized protein n=1 Tax=Ridgeia piscesae TaxID=27915 RepID=A0AAD9L2P1_RIDPI|nr:hypothetical protein NP493_386g05052 [Ridgeia piscesae]